MTERDLHKSVFALFGALLSDEVIWHHSPNETASFRGREPGALRGFPDWVLSWRDAADIGRTGFIELKSDTGSVSQEQRFVLHRLQQHGHYVAVCKTIEAVEGTLVAWGVPMKGKLSA